MLQYLLFDLDGTLTESGRGVINGVKAALRHFQIDIPDEKSLSVFLGPPLKDSFMRFFDMEEAQAEEAVEAYRAYYHVTGVYENDLYPRVKEVLGRLKEKGFQMSISSSKPQQMVDIVLRHFDINEYFSPVVCGTDAGKLYTKEGVIDETLRIFAERENKSKDEIRTRAVMIGDRKHDIEGGKKNGLFTIGASWGYAPEGELAAAGADVIVDDMEALYAYLTRKL
ncbi:MAG: HAD hydrolase-like protein [Lachnospiraceae bacterium]|nr:HAD hydrolase-like protein [Lachnospiraceae bacterium]